MINIIILSKVWYIAHTYPLPKKYSNLINKEIFPYLWNSKYNPIRREVLYQSKLSGGLEIINIFFKAQSIMSSTFLKQFLKTNDNHILKYFCAIRLNPLLDITELPSNVSFTNPEYYNDSIAIIRKLKHIRNFPNIRSKGIYEILLPKCQPIIESKIQMKWKITWKHLNFRFINIHERELMFKFLHGILTTRLRLFNIKQASSPQCNRCGMVEDNLHMFNACVKVKHIVIYFKNLVETLCDVKNLDMRDVLYLQKLSNNKLECNTLVVLTSAFIGTI